MTEQETKTKGQRPATTLYSPCRTELQRNHDDAHARRMPHDANAVPNESDSWMYDKADAHGRHDGHIA